MKIYSTLVVKFVSIITCLKTLSKLFITLVHFFVGTNFRKEWLKAQAVHYPMYIIDSVLGRLYSVHILKVSLTINKLTWR